MRLLTLLALAALLAIPARANIGEDIDQLRARYGSALTVGNQQLFQHDGYSIAVYFDGPHSAMEVFVRDGSKNGLVDITQPDIDAILAAEGEGQTWQLLQGRDGKSVWVRADHKLVARFTTGDRPEDKYLTVMLNAK